MPSRKKSRKGSASRSKSRSKSHSKSRSQTGGKSKNKWIEFTKKNRSSVISKLKKQKNYPEGQKGAMKLQQDAMKEMSKMYKGQ